MRLIDVDKAYKVLTEYYHHKIDVQHDALKEALGKVPTVDAEPVVRCKDCRFRYQDGANFCLLGSMCMSDEWFCADGERREDE